MKSMNQSEVAQFRQQQALQEQAAQQGLAGLAAVAYHTAITKRMERAAERVLQLVEQGKHAEAKALMLSDDLWRETGTTEDCKKIFTDSFTSSPRCL